MTNQNTIEAYDMLWSLPVDDRNVAYLYYCEGLDVSDIAHLLDRNVHTVSSLLYNARKELRKHI